MQHFDLVIIGSGSANSIVDERFADQRVALVDSGTFGGTCLNVGCIPTKMFVYPADLAGAPAQAARLGVDLQLTGVHWPAIRDRIFGRIDPISAGGKLYREKTTTLYVEESQFVAPRTLRVGQQGTITGDRFVIGAGSRPVIPDLPGLGSSVYYTSDTIMRLPELPDSMVIIGGGYIAAEFAHVFASYGTKVTVLNRSTVMLRPEDADVSARFTELLGRRVDLRLNTKAVGVKSVGDEVRVETEDADGIRGSATGAVLLIATGRMANGDRLNLEAAGVEVDDQGFVKVDAQQRTTADGVFALGDVSSHHQLKHVANHEARVVQHNLLHPDALRSSDHRFIPHAVFSEPQVASVGMTEAAAKEAGVDYRVGLRDYGDTAYGWAMEDTEHFVKIITDRSTGLILGAHLIGPQASSLIQPLIQAMSFGQTAKEVARGQYWIHPAMAEVVENALLAAVED